jgi:hypothetical protein
MSLKVHFNKNRKKYSVFVVTGLITMLASTYFVAPKITEATCTDKTIDSGNDNNMTVPVSQLLSPEYVKSQNQLATEYYKTCVADGEAIVESKKMIQALTKSTVKWIDTAFNGNPAFVKDPDAFFSKLAYSVAGNTIENVVQPSLTSPFKSALIPALSAEYSGQNSDGSTQNPLSSNLNTDEYNNFINGTDGSWSWDDWNSITQNPQNNPFGAMMLAEEQIDNSVANSEAKYQQQLDWGRGFLNSENCPSDSNSNSQDTQVYDENGEPVYGVEVNNSGCVTVTPGATIQDALDNIVAGDLNGLEVAQNIDDIYQPLTGQLMTQTIEDPSGLDGADDTASGLGGGAGLSGYGGGSDSSGLGGLINGLTNTLGGSSGLSGLTNGLSGVLGGQSGLSGLTNSLTNSLGGSSGLSGLTNGLTNSLGGLGGQGNGSSGSSGASADNSNNSSVSNTTISSPSIICAEFPSTVSIKTPVTWEAVALNGIPPFTYYWTGDENFSGIGTTTVKTYTTTGLKTATVFVTDARGNTYSNICSSVVSVTP